MRNPLHRYKWYRYLRQMIKLDIPCTLRGHPIKFKLPTKDMRSKTKNDGHYQHICACGNKTFFMNGDGKRYRCTHYCCKL